MNITLSNNKCYHIFKTIGINKIRINKNNISLSTNDKLVLFINSEKIILTNEDVNKSNYVELANADTTTGVVLLFLDIANSQLSKEEISFEVELLKDGKEEWEKNTYTYHNEFIEKYITTKNINSDRMSFMLLRTNPKLSGNAKLVIDSKNDIYLDTFKINSTLSNIKNRHKNINSNSTYSYDVKNLFSNISKKEVYDIPKDSMNMFNLKNKLHQQYEDTYFYGVKNNDDNLYSENFSILAPLYINEELPDFFLIFKLNETTLRKNDYCALDNPTDKLKYLISNGEIIKSFDLRKNTSIGNYLNNIIKENEKYSTSIFLSLNDYTPNQWNGISLERGLISSVQESSYHLTKIKNQVDYDRYITNGFERNGLLNSHLINLEFMFNDDSSEDFTINRYFGLYVSNIHLKNIYVKNKNIYNENFEEIDIDDIFNEELDENMIFNLTDKNQNFIRIKSKNDLNNFINNNTNYSYQNIFYSDASYVNNLNNKEIMTININDSLSVGSHFKIIDSINNNIYEVIFSNIDDTKYDNVEEYYNNENGVITNYKNGNITIYRNIAPGYNENKNIKNFNTKDEVIKTQIKYAVESFKSILPSYVTISYYDNNIHFENNNNELKLTFEYITSNVLYNYTNEDIIENELSIFNNVTFFNESIPYVLLNPFNNGNTLYQPLDFEILNNRAAYIVDFLKFDNNKSLYTIPISKYKNIVGKNIIVNYNDTADCYLNIVPISLSFYNTDGYFLLKKNKLKKDFLITENNKNCLLQLDTNITNINKLNFYSITPLKINVSGITPIKDFNFNVLDKIVFDMGEEGKDEYDEEYNIENNSNYNIPIIRDEKVSCESFYNYISLLDEDYDDSTILDDKIKNYYNNSKREMDVPLTIPTNCKWKIYGKDILNNKIKSTTFFNLTNDASSYRLYIDNKNDIFGFPTFTDTSIVEDKLYINNNIFNMIKNENTGLYSSILNDILYNKSNINHFIKDSDKFVKIFYNSGEKSLETIFFGAKIKIKNDDIDLSHFNNYLFTIICLPNANLHTTPFEVIFDKNNKIIMGLWYFGNGNATVTNNTKNNNDDFIKLNVTVSLKANDIKNEKIPFIVNKNITEEGEEILSNEHILLSALSNNDYFTFDNKNYTTYINNSKCENNYLYSSDSSYYNSISDSSLNVRSNNISTTNNIVNAFLYDTSNNISTIYNFINRFNINTFENIISHTIYYHIIDSNNTQSYKNDNLKISIVEPISKIIEEKKYYIYDGYLEPDFINIIDFNKKDKLSINGKDYDMFSNNLTIKNVNNIKQLWVNKIFTDIENYNTSNEDEYYPQFSLDVLKNIDITRNCWDDNFYKTITNNETKYVSGYNESKDIKTFFGSQGIVLKNKEIIITNWDGFYNVKNDIKNFDNYDDEKYKTNVTLDITSALKNHIIKNSNILNNWLNVSNNSNVIDNYISNLIKNYYNINNKNIIKFYRRKKSSNSLIVSYIDETFEEVSNITSELIYSNDNYYISFMIPYDDNFYEYAIKYIIEK